MHHPIPMPVRGEPSAPTFDGDPKRLKWYFHHVEHLAARACASDAEKIESAILYLDPTVYDLWKQLAESIPADWDRFKSLVYEYYPVDSDPVTSILAIAKEAKKSPLETYDTISFYYRRFSTFALELRKRNIYEEQDFVMWYLSGFPKSDHDAIKKQFGRAESELTLRDVYRASLCLYTDSVEPDSTTFPLIDSPPAPSPKPTPVAESPDPIPSSSSPSPSSPSIPSSCHFCSDTSHIIRTCPVAARYLRTGLVKKDINGKFITPTGLRITRAIPGTTFQEQIDHWHRHQHEHAACTSPAPPPPSSFHVSSHPSPSSSSPTNTSITPSELISKLSPAVREKIKSLLDEAFTSQLSTPSPHVPSPSPAHIPEESARSSTPAHRSPIRHAFGIRVASNTTFRTFPPSNS